MLKLHVLQAEFGDCLMLEFGAAATPRFILIDGGPRLTFERTLDAALKALIAPPRILEMVILSHVDGDHISGLLDLMAELRRQEVNGEPPTATVRELWHNSFSRTLDPGGDIQLRLRTTLAAAGAPQTMELASEALAGIGEGNGLRLAALAMGIPINDGFQDDLISVDSSDPPRLIDNLTLRVVGPTQANLDALAAEWREWLEQHEEAVASGDPFVMANSDRSIPNLSSVMVLAEGDGKSILLTGDGRSDHLLSGLERGGLLQAGGSLHVNVLKLPHHGSNRNITKKFFRTVTADCYVASANGKNDNPDLSTLAWLVEAAHEQGREVQIAATNRTLSIVKLLEEYPPGDFGYSLRVLPTNAPFLTIPLHEPA